MYVSMYEWTMIWVEERIGRERETYININPVLPNQRFVLVHQYSFGHGGGSGGGGGCNQFTGTGTVWLYGSDLPATL